MTSVGRTPPGVSLGRLGRIGFPYLLTGTEPLLREEVWDPAMGVPISRSPAAAIYSQVLLETFRDPMEAARHTVQAAFKVARVERDLRSAPAYVTPELYSVEPDLESALANGRIGASLRAQLMTLRDVVNDKVIYAAQRVYENADLMAENISQQHDSTRVTRRRDSPRRLFDLIASLDAAMNEPQSADGRRGLGSLWSTVLKLEVDQREGYTVYELRDRGGRANKPPYFTIEVHQDEGTKLLFVMRWPGGLDAASVLAAIARSFDRHDEQQVELVVGTSTDVLRFEAELPLFLEEITAAVSEAHALMDQADMGEFRWARFNGKAFDVYADIAAEAPHDPVVGVFAPSLHAEHVTDLYQQSSARYLFAAWLQGALVHIANVVAPEHDAEGG